eukprot:gene3599-6334_t
MAKKNKKRRDREKKQKEEERIATGKFEKEQWVSKVYFSSSEHKKSPATNLIGKTTTPKGEDQTQQLVKGWTPLKDKGTTEVIEVGFPSPGPVSEIHIYETYNGGAVVKISGRKSIEDPWVVLWSTNEPEIVTEYRVFNPLLNLPSKNFEIQDIRLELDCRRECKVTQIGGICLISERDELHPLKFPKKMDMSLFSDATIIIEDKRFPVHKMVISNYSQKLFNEFLNKSEYTIKDVSIEHAEYLLDFMYTGRYILDQENLEKLMPDYDAFGIEFLLKRGVESMLTETNSKEVIPLLLKAYKKELKFDSTPVIEGTIRFIENNCYDVILEDNWSKLPEDILIQILKSSRLVVDEVELFDSVLKWGKKNDKSKIPDLLQYIRFPQMTIDDLKKVVKTSGFCPTKAYDEAMDYNKNPDKYEDLVDIQFMQRAQLLVGSKIVNAQQSMQVLKFINDKSKKWKLCYQATKDGFGTNHFHSKCDKFKESIVIIKSTNNNVFGAYCADPWSGSGYSNNPKTFLFSLVNSANSPQKIESKKQSNEQYRYSSYGPTFGSGHDLYICNNSNTTNSSYSNYPYSYNTPKDFTGTQNTFLAGSYNFKTIEIEVFGLQ